MSKKKLKHLLIYLVVFLVFSALAALLGIEDEPSRGYDEHSETGADTLEHIQPYSGSPYVAINNHEPYFTEEDLTTDAFETFEELDWLGRCGVTYANVCQELMPTEYRGDISMVYPSGWDNNPYPFVDGEYLYNRCHLIGFQLTGENANKRNLVTGTRYMNVDGMLPFENMVADHVKEDDHHVLYRVTPIFEGDNLVCSGVQMEALCVECHKTPDEDDDFFFNVYCYNVQPGVEINYATGENWEAQIQYTGEEFTYVMNTSSKKFHDADCENAINMNPDNRAEMTCTRQELIDKGYKPAGCCNP